MKNFFIKTIKLFYSYTEFFSHIKFNKKFLKNLFFQSFKFSISLFIIIGLTYSPSSPVSNVKSLEAATTTVILTSGTTWAVPADWNDNANWIEVIGGGGKGFSAAATGEGGGGGGAYSLSRNVNMPESTTVTINVGLGGTSAGVNGGDTFICNTQNSGGTCDAITDGAVVTGAKGGLTATSITGVAGGSAASGVATGAWGVKFSGGTGGTGNATGKNGGGGGGAAGPRGPGTNGGAGGNSTTNHGGGGGGGNGGATAAGTAGSTTGGAGANGSSATGSGAGGNANNGTAGTAGTGGGGGGGDSTFSGGAGATSTSEWSGTHGAGGGGGGAGSTSGNGGNGGLYGAGGGGGVTGGLGANGIIVITYIPTTVALTTVFITSGTSWSVPADWNSTENFVEVIGGGGGGNDIQTNGSGGGGGGAYALTRNVSLTPGGSATIQVGAGGNGTPTAGTDTWFNGASCAASSTCAKGGSAGGTTSGGAGGLSTTSIGSIRYKGGTGGGGNNTGDTSGGGGGAGGRRGIGANGGAGNSTATEGGGGGGGAGGGGSNGTAGAAAAGGAGGNGYGGSGGGTAGNNVTCGSGGTGGAGTAGTGAGGGGGDKLCGGGAGSIGQEWDATHGSGSGGGGSGSTTAGAGLVGGAGGTYGGGGGGGGTTNLGGAGGQGLIAVTYRPVAVTATTTGTQTANMTVGATNQYVGGAFAFSSTASLSINGITITESGTADGTNLDNIKLYYESDTSASYDCASESYAGTELQFGSTDADGFSAANGTATFSGSSIGISSTSTLCVYVVLDVTSGSASQTIELSINSSTDFTTASSLGTRSGTFPLAISGTTTLQAAAGITVSGILYGPDGTTPEPNVKGLRLSVNGAASQSTSSTVTTGAFSFTVSPGPSDGDVITIWVNNELQFGTLVLKYGPNGCSPNCSVPIQENVILIKDNSSGANISNTNLAGCDIDTGTGCTDADIKFTSNAGSLVVSDGIGLTTLSDFTPGGTITMSSSADGADSNLDGDITIGSSTTLDMGTNALSIGGDFTNSGTFTIDTGQTTTFTATATGHTIAAGGVGESFYNMVFNGSGGDWILGSGDFYVDGDLTISAGTFKGPSGAGNLFIHGNFTGTGTGTFNSTSSNGYTTIGKPASGNINFGGATQWTFDNGLFIGDASGTGTITKTGAGAISVTNGKFSLTNSTTFNAGSVDYFINSSGTGASKPFDIQTGSTFSAQTSNVYYVGTSATDITALSYYNLTFAPASGSQTYTLGTATSQTLTVGNLFQTISAGGTMLTINADTFDPVVDVNGTFYLDLNSTFIASASVGMTVAGAFSNEFGGTFTHSNGTVTMDGASTFNISNTSAFYNLIFNNASGTWTATGDLNIGNVLTITAGNFNASSRTITFSGSGTQFVNNATFTQGTSTVVYSSNSAQNITALNGSGSTNAYYNLEAKTSIVNNTKTILGNTTVKNVLTIGSSNPIHSLATLDLGSYTLTLSGSGTPITFGDAATGRFTANTGTVIYTSTTGISALSSLAMTSNNAFYNLTIDGDGGGDTFTTGQDFTATNDLTVTTGDILSSANNVIVNGVVTGDGVITHTANTFTHNMISTKNFGGAGNWSFYNLTFNKNGISGTGTATGAGSVTVNGQLVVSAGTTLQAGSKTWILTNSTVGFLDVIGTLTPQTSTFSFRGTTNADVQANNYYNVDFSPASGTPAYNFLGATLNANNFTIGGAANATVNIDDEVSVIDINGDVTIGSGDGLELINQNMTVGGSWTNSGNFTNSASVVTFDGTGSKTIDAGAGNGGFSSITFNNAGGTWTLTSTNLNVNGVLNIAAGNLDASSRTITLLGSGTPFLRSGTFTYGTSTVNYTGTSVTNIAALNGSGSTNAYYNLGVGTTADSSSVTYTPTSDITVNNVITVSNASSTGIDTLSLNGLGNVILKGSGTPLNPISGKGAIDTSASTIYYSSSSGVTNLANAAFTFGDLIINGTGTFNAVYGFAALNATISSGTLVTGSGEEVSVSGHFTGNGTVSMPSDSYLLLTEGNLGGDTAWTLGGISIVDGTVSAAGTGAITASSIYINGRGALYAGSKTWNISGIGTAFNNLGSFFADTSTFNYTGAGATDITPETYYNLGIKPGANSTTHTLGSGNFIVNNNLVIGDGSHTGDTVTAVNVSSLTINGSGTTVDIKAGTTFVAPPSLVSFSVGGSWSNAGTFTHSGGAVNFGSGSIGNTVTSGGSQFYDVVFNGSGGGWSPSDAMSLAGDLTVTNGTLSGTNDISVSGGDVTGNGTINMTGGTFSTTGQGNFGGNTGWTFSSLTSLGASNTTTATGTGSITISGVLNVGNTHTLNAGSKTWYFTGAGTPITGNGTFASGTSTVEYNSPTGITALASTARTGTKAFYNLVINSAGDTFTAGVAVGALNSLTVSGGIFDLAGNHLDVGTQSITNSGSIKVASGQTLTQSSAGNTTIISSNPGTNCIGGVGALCVGNPGTITFGNLIIGDGNEEGNHILNLSGTTPTISATTIMIMTGSVFNAGTLSNINITGNGTPFTITGFFDSQTSTISFNSAGTNGTIIPAATYHNLVLNKISNSFSAEGDITTKKDFTITNGTFVAPSTVTVKGDFTNDGTYTHSSGTFIIGSGLPFGTSSSVKGASNTTFYNFTDITADSILKFKAGNTYTFAGTLNLTGENGSPINLSSDDAGGAQWFMTLSGSATANYLKVKDSGCSGIGNFVAASRFVHNYGNNGAYCWRFFSNTIFQGGAGIESSASHNGIISGGGGGGGGGSVGGSSDIVNARGTAVLSNNTITGVTINFGGSGYVIPPIVSICGGGGSGAAGTAVLSGGAVESVNMTNNGSAYSTVPLVLFGSNCPQGGGGGGGAGGGGGGDSGFNYKSSNLAYAGGSGVSLWSFIKSLLFSWW